MANDRLRLTDVPRMLHTLSCGEQDARQTALKLLCPCRNKIYSRELWLEIFRLYDEASLQVIVYNDASFEPIRNQAAHAIETLVEYSLKDPNAKELLEWLTGQGVDSQVKAPALGISPKKEKVTWRDVPRLLDILSCADSEYQTDTLKLLCPCRNRLYDREIWLAICDAAENGDTGTVRDQAGHAIGTLKERAAIDPRSQKLITWLMQEGAMEQTLSRALPEWSPTGRAGLDGLYIPRYERSPRSKSNRRK